MKYRTPVIQRKQRKQYEESRMLRFLYDTRVGHKMLKIAVKPYVSMTAGKSWTAAFQKYLSNAPSKKTSWICRNAKEEIYVL